MKKLILLFALSLLISTLTQAQDCSPNGLTFTDQEQIDSFPINYPTWTIINGDLTIKGSSIFQLDSLYQIEAVNGTLTIQDCDSLASVTGLSGLSTVHSASFLRLPNLKTIDCFENITSLDGDLTLLHCDSLSNISSFHNISNINS
jgi:hypothetical protein